MIIRKKYKFESAHIVRNCSSIRCSESIHGHSYIVEVFIKSNHLDNGQMVYDFGLMTPIKNFIDRFDHSYVFWKDESSDFKKFIRLFSDRWIEMPLSPTAECFSLIFFKFIDEILNNTKFKNGEKRVELHSVRVHETATGYAECFKNDMHLINKYETEDIKFSESIMKG